MEFNNIGFFQFDNLLQNRVPMILVFLDEVPVRSWYNSLVGMHLDNISLKATAETTVAAIEEKKLPKHFAIVVIDLDESKSPPVVKNLENLGHLNVYYVKGGWNGIAEERLSANK